LPEVPGTKFPELSSKGSGDRNPRKPQAGILPKAELFKGKALRAESQKSKKPKEK